MTALGKNSIPNDWLPEGKVFLYNCFTDLFGSSICGDALYDYLKEINADVEYIHEDMTHEQMIVYMVMDFYNYLYPDKLFGLL
jgi:hypothetical protein